MTLYGFRDRRTAENLKYIGETMHFQRNSGITRKTGSEVKIAKVTEDIDAVLNGVWLSGAALIVERKQDGTKVVTENNITLFNTTGEDLAVDDEVTVIREGQKWITVSGAAGGSGASLSMFVSTSSIPADGEGTANDRTYDGTSWTTGTNSFTIVNPWSDAVSSGKKLTAYEHSSGKWIMVQAECEDTV